MFIKFATVFRCSSFMCNQSAHENHSRSTLFFCRRLHRTSCFAGNVYSSAYSACMTSLCSSFRKIGVQLHAHRHAPPHPTEWTVSFAISLNHTFLFKPFKFVFSNLTSDQTVIAVCGFRRNLSCQGQSLPFLHSTLFSLPRFAFDSCSSANQPDSRQFILALPAKSEDTLRAIFLIFPPISLFRLLPVRLFRSVHSLAHLLK